MRNNDKLTRDEIRGNIQQAVKDGDTEAFTKSFDQMILCIQEDIWQRAETQIDEMRQAADNRILSERGVRQLTSRERVIIRRLSPLREKDPRQAINNLDGGLPETVIERGV